MFVRAVLEMPEEAVTRHEGHEDTKLFGGAMARVFRKLSSCSSCVFVAAFDAAAQGKKVYISVDMEGISGVVGDDQTSAGGRSTAARAS